MKKMMAWLLMVSLSLAVPAASLAETCIHCHQPTVVVGCGGDVASLGSYTQCPKLDTCKKRTEYWHTQFKCRSCGARDLKGMHNHLEEHTTTSHNVKKCPY